MSNQIKNSISFFFFPLFLLYEELVLRFLTGTARLPGLVYIVFFSLSAGFFWFGFLSFWHGKAARILTDIVMWCIAVLFAMESVVRSVFTTYMTPENLLFASGNASANYTAQVVRSILFGIPKFLLFAVPVILYLVFTGKSPERIPRRGTKEQYTEPLSLEDSALITALALVLTWAVSLCAANGSRKAVYGAQFDYNRATETFGLITSTRLASQYSLFGNDNVTYFTTEESAAAEDADSETVEATEDDGSETVEAAEDNDREPDKTMKSESTGTESASNDTAASEEDQSGQTDEDDADADDATETSDEPAFSPVPQVMDIDFSSVEQTGMSEIDSLTAFVETRTPTETNAYTGLFEGKNLILICAESYSSYFISPELTPTLWRLTTEGFYFTEYYQPEWGGSTTTGEASFLLGLAPKDGDQTMNATVGHNNYFTMGNALQRLGYSSCAFHNGSVYYYNRNLTHTNLGYNQFIANENGLGTLVGHNYARDTEMFDATMDLYLMKEPFSIYYMTASGHAPYDAGTYYTDTYYERVNEIVGDTYAEKTKYYICKQMELETALTLMIKKLEDAGIADNTVIALVGDHYPYGLGTGEAWGNDRDYISDLIKGDSTVPFEEDRSGLILWSESLEGDLTDMACTVDTPVFSLDVVPTLMNLFGLPYDSRLLPGRDVFADAEPLVFWNNLSWVTTYGKYDARHGVYYPKEGYETDEAYQKEGYDGIDDYRAKIDAEVQNRILMSRSLVSTDYFGRLFGADEVTQAGEIIFPES